MTAVVTYQERGCYRNSGCAGIDRVLGWLSRLDNMASDERKTAWNERKEAVRCCNHCRRMPALRKSAPDKLGGVRSKGVESRLLHADKAFFRRFRSGGHLGCPRCNKPRSRARTAECLGPPRTWQRRMCVPALAKARRKRDARQRHGVRHMTTRLVGTHETPVLEAPAGSKPEWLLAVRRGLAGAGLPSLPAIADGSSAAAKAAVNILRAPSRLATAPNAGTGRRAARNR